MLLRMYEGMSAGVVRGCASLRDRSRVNNAGDLDAHIPVGESREGASAPNGKRGVGERLAKDHTLHGDRTISKIKR